MSWQAYVDTSLIGTGNVDKAAIFSAAGDSVWAQSPGFTVKPEEIRAIIASFADQSNIFGSGFYVAGEKQMTISSDARTLVGKKGKTGVVCVKTLQAVLVAHHGEETATTNARASVEALADYLIGVKY